MSIPTSVLTTNGFLANQSNAISIIKPASNSEKIGLVSLALKDDDVALHSTTRAEAEAAALNGGTIQSGTTVWSNSSYLGDMGTKSTLSDASQISADLSNVNSLSFSYTAAETGVYDIYIRYATGTASTAYLRVDQGSWVAIDYVSTSWWDTPRVAHIAANMIAGARTITLTGTTTAGGWINYDCIDIVEKGALTTAEVALNYAVFFREQTASGCTAKNVNLIPWAQLKSEYLSLSSAAKDEFVDSIDATIADARARYQVLINAYSTLAADNWLVDGDDNVVYSSALVITGDVDSQRVLLVMAGFAIIISSLGACFLFRRRKPTKG